MGSIISVLPPQKKLPEYHLTPQYIGEGFYDEMFATSDNNDAILVVDGKKIHVNKACLSFHSEFFRVLFSSNFKEGQMTEIPIKDVSYEEFGLLMSTILPKKVFPDEKTAAKLLELADRFLMPCVTNLVEHHLLNNSQISNEKMMWMADAYGMSKLLEKTIRAMDTVEKAKQLKASPEYKKLSKNAKIIFLGQVMAIITKTNLSPRVEASVDLIYTPKVYYDEMFPTSDKTDVILEIDGKKVHVNKAFLSFHSEFFTALFSSNSKEGQLAEIPIKDVSYEDFGLLMSTIYSYHVFTNDNTAEKLLELADRFLMPFITRQVEHHLLEHSKFGNEKLMWIADAYSMPKLLEKAILLMDTVEKVEFMQTSPEFEKLSDGAKAKLVNRLTQLI